jgi:hypothetical protein
VVVVAAVAVAAAAAAGAVREFHGVFQIDNEFSKEVTTLREESCLCS